VTTEAAVLMTRAAERFIGCIPTKITPDHENSP
jgi:hypothetical protein